MHRSGIRESTHHRLLTETLSAHQLAGPFPTDAWRLAGGMNEQAGSLLCPPTLGLKDPMTGRRLEGCVIKNS